MRIVVIVALAWIPLFPGLAAAQAPPSCEDQLRAAGELIPHLEESRRQYEHLFAQQKAQAAAAIRRLQQALDAKTAELTQARAELEKLKPQPTPAAPAPKESSP